MPIRGENVGTAYVRILVDGSELPEGIRESIREAEPAMEQQGNRNADKYNKAFRDRIRKNSARNQKALAESLQVGAGRMDAIAQTMNDGLFKSLRKNLRSRVGGEDNTIADQIWKNLVGDFQKSGSFKDMLAGLENLPAQVDRAIKDIQRLEQKYARDRDDAHRENAKRDREITRAMLDEAYRLHSQFNRKQAAQDKAEQDRTRAMLNDAYQMHSDFNKKQTRMYTEAYRINAEFDRKRRFNLRKIREEYRGLLESLNALEKGERGAHVSTSKIYSDLRRLRSLLDRAGDSHGLDNEFKSIEKRVRNLHPRLSRMNKIFDDTANILARSTGKGSRNNFFNLFGAMVGGFVNLLTLGPRVIGMVGGEFTSAFQQAGGGLKGVTAGLGTLVSSAGAGVVALGAIAIAAGALFVVLGPLVAMVSLLVGALVALAGTVAFAAAAGLTAVVGALVPLVAGLGVGVLAIQNLSEGMKKTLADAVRPLRKGFADLGRDAAKVLTQDIAKDARALRPVLGELRPVVLHIADALRVVTTRWSEMLASPGFERFLNRIDKFLPGAMKRLGDITAHTLGGLGGIFTGAIPMLKEFLRWLDKITTRFSDWANSAAGQREIKQFFSDASDSAKSLGGFLESVWKFTKLLLTEGKGAGDDLFTSLGGNVDKFTQFLKDNPDALTNWFNDSKEFARNLGNIIIDIGRLFDELDNPESRDAILSLSGALDDLADSLDHVADASNFALKIADGIKKIREVGSSDFFDPARLADRIASDFASAFSDVGGRIKGLWNKIDWPTLTIGGGKGTLIARPNIGNIANWFSGLAGRIKKAIGHIDIKSLISLPTMGTLSHPFSGLNNLILRQVGRIPFIKNIDLPSLSKIAGHFSGWYSAILARIGKIDVGKNFNLPSLSSIADHFVGLAGQILSAIGTIDLTGLFHIPNSIGGIHIPGQASGGMFGQITAGPMLRWVGEDGPEAIVPLARDLSRVDPAVRALSAIAQGIAPVPNGGDTTPRKVIDASGWQIHTSGTDARAVAAELLNQMTAQAY